MIKINLNPEKKKAKIKKKGVSLKAPSFAIPAQNFIYISIPVVIILVEIGYYFYINFQIKDLEAQKRNLLIEKTRYRTAKRHIDILKQKIKEAERMKDEVAIKIDIYQKLAKEKTDFSKILYEIASSVPDGIWITNLSLSRDKSSLKGYTFDPQFISIFYKNLKKFYRHIEFKSTKREKSKNLIFYSFDFEMKKREGLSDKSGGK